MWIRALLLLTALAIGSSCSEIGTVKRVRGLPDKPCACTDAPCADAVEKEYRDLVKEGQKRGSEDDREGVADAYSRMRDCIASARASAKATPAAPPATP